MSELMNLSAAELRARIANAPANTRSLHFFLGLRLAADGDHEGAANAFDNERGIYAAAGVPDNNINVVLAAWQGAKSCVQLMNDQRALPLVRNINLRRVWGHGNDLSLKGDVLRRLGFRAEAKDAYLEALQVDKHCVMSHRWLSHFTHDPTFDIARPEGFAPPERSEWVTYEGFEIPGLDDRGEAVWAPAPSSAWIRLFRKKYVVATWGFEMQGTGPTLMVEKVACMTKRRWGLPDDFVWISLSEHGVRETFDFSRVTFGPPTRPDELGEPSWTALSTYDVEQALGYRFVWY